MHRLSLILPLLAAFGLTSCGETAIDGRYGCGTDGSTDDKVFLFRADGSVDEVRQGRGLFYVESGNTVKIVRDTAKDAAGTNVQYEFTRDGERLVLARNQRYACQPIAANQNSSAATPTATGASADTAAPFVARERPASQPAEIRTVRLGDTIADVERKMAALETPLELRRRMLAPGSAQDVFTSLEFNAGVETVNVHFSPPPQRAIAVNRGWHVGGQFDPLSWPKLLEAPVARHGPASVVEPGDQRWFLAASGKTIDPPPFAAECPDGFQSVQRLAARCGQMLAYRTGTPNGPVSGFQVYLFDNQAMIDADRTWQEMARGAQAGAEAQAEAKLRDTPLPQQ